VVEQQRRLSLPPGYKPPRKGPSRAQVLTRRLLALGVLLLVVLGGVVVVQHVTRSKPKPPPPIVVAKPLRITFPEGFTRRDMAARITAVDAIARQKRHVSPRLRASAYLALTAKSKLPGTAAFAGDNVARSLEGFLFPSTYDFTGKEPTSRLVQDQLAAFRRVWSGVDLRYAKKHRLNGYDVLIIASMIEKEALAPEDRAKIAAVIYNRLSQGMALGVDATLRYGLDIPGTKPLGPYVNSKNPYNTRKYAGLPPTPIANPGLPSIRAAAHPARGCWTYFLAKPDKRHTYFTCSFKDFVNHEHQYGYLP
jgi:peptidoglycan lytic transglycosylase G